jgi:hypothetical protein
MKVLIFAVVAATLTAGPAAARRGDSRLQGFVVRNMGSQPICSVVVFEGHRAVKTPQLGAPRLEHRGVRRIPLRLRTHRDYLVEVRTCDGQWTASRRIRRVSGLVDVTVVDSRRVATESAVKRAQFSTMMALERADICPPRRDGRLETRCRAHPRRPPLDRLEP